VEAFGTKNSEQDAEIILIATQILKKLNIDNTNLSINNIGDSDTRIKYESKLRNYFNDHKNSLSELSKARLEKNPMRILDSKEKEDQTIIKNAPMIKDLLSTEEKEHFSSVLTHLKGLGINYNENPYLVRGLDYYNGTTFEITTQSTGSQNALCGGGRYDSLVEKMGGPETPAVGFAAGIERIILEAKQELGKKNIDIYISCNDEKYTSKGLNIIQNLVENEYKIFFDTNKKNIKNQIKDAVKNNAKFMITINEEISVKNLISKKETNVSESEILPFLKNQ
jgi:histidyl-tRNA synthetase